jgi:nitrogen fixation/metabolism regulation signal transduction histidine kinase
MVDEFSRFARLPDVKLESRDLNDVILQSVALYEDRFDDISIKTSLAEDLPRGLIDEEQLKRVFVNLIDNSVEAFSDSQAVKRVEITSAFDTSRDVLVATVTDNGSGFAPQDLSRIFQPYFSTKGRGTGLGLAIVERIINEHHGKVSAASVKPTGAQFVLEIPVAA